MAERRHFPTLGPTNPYTRGPNVQIAQELMKHNRFGRFYGGPVDGVYGPHTAHAARSAKYWLGYPKRHLKPNFSQHLHDYLLSPIHEHHRRLPRLYKLRRMWRVAAHKKWVRKHNLPLRALKHAESQIGVKESPPGSNDVYYTRWYNMVGPWCMMFVTWAFVEAGSKVFQRSERWASVEAFHDDVAAGRVNASFTDHPKPGTVMCYDFVEPFQHAEMFKRWEERGVSFWAVGGNTGGTDPADGGMVADSLRYMNQVQFMVEVHA